MDSLREELTSDTAAKTRGQRIHKIIKRNALIKKIIYLSKSERFKESKRF